MSKVLSLKLQDKVFRETEEILRKSRKPRNAYFNEAINLYNKLQKRKLLKCQLMRESGLVAADSLDVLKAFERLGASSAPSVSFPAGASLGSPRTSESS